MNRRLEIIACALLAVAGTAAADESANGEMAMHHQKMLDDCVAKQNPATDKHAAMKACIDMLDKREDHMPHPDSPRADMPHAEAGKEAPVL